MAKASTKLVRRNLEDSVRAGLSDTPVVMLTGPRQSGKSTLAQELVRAGVLASYTTLDDLVMLDAARRDPVRFVSERRGGVIDEIQRAPDLLLAIKAAVDRDRRPGAFLLTGSADVLHLPTAAESLAGRIELLTLWPFSQSELESRKDTFIDKVFDAERPAVSEERDVRADVLRRAMRGGFPEALARTDPARRGIFFDNLVATVIEREVPLRSDVAGRVQLNALLRLLAARSMSIANLAEISRGLELSSRTVARYTALLELVYLSVRIHAWSGNLGRRLVRHPKIALSDSGLMAHLAPFDEDRLQTDPVMTGGLLETFVAMELRKGIGWSGSRPQLLHYRSHLGSEVDLVLELRSGKSVGIEVKASSTVRGEDFKGLETLRQALGRKFVLGIVLYTGRSTVSFGERLIALPMSALWKL